VGITNCICYRSANIGQTQRNDGKNSAPFDLIETGWFVLDQRVAMLLREAGFQAVSLLLFVGRCHIDRL
jgi:hypothetical protein